MACAVFAVHQLDGGVVDVGGHRHDLVNASRRRHQDKHVLDGHLFAGMHASTEEIDGGPWQPGRNLARKLGKVGVRSSSLLMRAGERKGQGGGQQGVGTEA